MGDTALLQLFPVTGLQLCAALIAEQCIVRDGRAALRAGLAGRLGGLFRGSFFCLLHGGFVVHLSSLGRGQGGLQAGDLLLNGIDHLDVFIYQRLVLLLALGKTVHQCTQLTLCLEQLALLVDQQRLRRLKP